MHSDQLELLVARPPGERMINSGVLLMRNSATVKEFLINVTSRRAWNDNWCEKPSKETWTTEQLQSATMKEQQRALQNLCKYYDKNSDNLSFPTNDVFVFHLARSKCPQVQEILDSLFKENPHLL